MRRPSARSLLQLRQTDETWQIATAELHIWVTPPDETPYRPHVILIVDLDNGALMASELTMSDPSPDEVLDVLYNAMRKPHKMVGPARRPMAIGMADRGLAAALAGSLTEIQVQAIHQPLPDEFQNILRELEEHMRGGQPEHLGLLSVKGVTPELVGGLFAAAAEFYRAAPWVQLTNYPIVVMNSPAEQDDLYACVMCTGGIQCELVVCLAWREVERFFASADGPLETIPDTGQHSFFFDDITMLPSDDLEAMRHYGWEVVNEQAYPIWFVVDRDSGARRPDRMELLWYEAALRAIPILVRDLLKPDGQGDYSPVETSIEVSSHAGVVKVDVKYPAGVISKLDQPAQEWQDLEEGESDEMPFFDRRAMEGAMFGMLPNAGTGDPQLDQAQQLMYQAWDETNPAKRLSLAHQALATSPDCADAYVLLAEEEADTLGRALEYYRQGVAAGERALGKEYFEENAGYFWGLLETRPYMRAREGLAQALWRLNRTDEAAEHYYAMLRLNPGDNQGIRYSLVDLLLQVNQVDRLDELLQQYEDDYSSEWTYTRALLHFRKEGASAQANKTLAKALKQNSHVPAYLTGKKRIPNRLPDYIGFGDENEAISYAANHLNYWRRTPGAVAWLGDRSQPAPKPARRAPAAKSKPKSAKPKSAKKKPKSKRR